MPGFDPSGRRAIVTGGARGLGLELSRRLVAEGAKVCISDIDSDAGQEAVAELGKKFANKKDSIHFVKCDVSSKDEWRSLWDEAESLLGGKIDILCNNAGVPPRVGYDNYKLAFYGQRCGIFFSKAGIDVSLNVMTIGATNGVRIALDRMSRSKGGNGGRIITTASCAGIVVRTRLYNCKPRIKCTTTF